MVKILKNKYSLFLAIEEINKNQNEWFKDSQEEIDPVLKNLDAKMLQRLNDDRDKSDQRARELEGSLGLV